MSGIQYFVKDLKRYSCVVCHECGIVIIGDKKKSGAVRISCVCPQCYPDFRIKRNVEQSKKKKKYNHENKSKQKKQYLERRLRNKKLVFTHYSNGKPRCNCCNESDDRFLTIDHINNDGAEHRKKVNDIYAWIVRNNFPIDFQILCYNCNCAKNIYGECPHKIPLYDNGMIDDELFIQLGNELG